MGAHGVDRGADEAAFRQLWGNGQVPLTVLQLPRGRLRWVNPALCTLVGRAADDLAGARLDDLVHPEDRAGLLEALYALNAGRGPVPELPVRLRLEDGSFRSMRWSAAPPDEQGVSVVMLTPNPELDEQLDALRELEARFHLAMTHAPIGMAISVLDGPWVAVNPALCALFGRDEHELLDGASFAELTHPDDLPGEFVLLEELIAGLRTHYSLDKRYLRPDGEVVWTTTVVTLVRNERDEPRYFVAQCLDITERRRIEDELRETAARLAESDNLRVAFLRATSHELRTPLTVVDGLAETLVRLHGELSPERVRLLLERIEHHTARLSRLIEDLLDVDRLTSGLIVARREPTDLHRLLRAVLDTVELRGRRLTTSLPAMTVAVDPPKVERIIANLIANAVRHTAPDGRIRVDAETRDGQLLITVEDDGEGIPDGFEQRIFEPFMQGPRCFDDPQPGTGLGLSLVQEFAALHGGKVRAVNRRGGGARFEVLLPLTGTEH